MVTDRCGSVIWQAMDVIVWTGIRRANGLGFSGGAVIDRESYRADSCLQNSNDLVGAKRRPLQARVGPLPGALFQCEE